MRVRWPTLGGFIWHPFVLGLFYVLSIYQTNAEHHPLSVVWLPMFVALGAMTVLLGLASLARANTRAAALGCSLGVIVLLIAPFFQELFDARFHVDSGPWVVGLLAVLAALILRAMGKERRRSASVTRLFNLGSLCCLFSPLFLLATSLGNGKTELVQPESWAENSTATVSEDAPDIYYIILDGYARGDVLKRLYQFDNQDFLAALKARGFHVADAARANYCQTGLSMASALNSRYLELPARYEKTNARQVLKTAIHQSAVPAFLRAAGYQLRIYDSGYYLTDSLAGAERVETTPAGWNEFAIEVVRKTLAGLPVDFRRRVMVGLGRKTIYPRHRTRIINAFDSLAEESASTRAPTFTFVHVLAPHPPFVLSDPRIGDATELPYSMSDGNHLVSELSGGAEGYQRLYVSQLKAVNELVLNAVGRLMDGATRPLVVLIQSDHGPGSKLDWDDARLSDPAERMGILSAFYFSDGDYARLYPEISPVNSWRVVLNQCFPELNLPRLEDRSYLSSWRNPYLFHEVDFSEPTSAP